MGVNKRKPLNDALAKEFVYGENGTSESSLPKTEPIEETARIKSVESQQPVTIEEKKPSIMDKLQPIEQREATKRFTVDLPDSMHRKLSILAAKTGRTKADIVRVLLDDVLKDIDE
ncbi:hypothetical protein VB715_18780 [Crocosphaera sp. UHCC 0190]|uniref:hypothetical protein n=1 Tax=Crocosphaera sp. UHCC 0190 TaxID=3110246 RepID=UPI002B1EB03E|nr:hypothetical protein [Crocosphaera sp. UHCC 0190]MEA5511821.1 hypothetical protein [Crocosphaera sp. UHCC 0190]